MIADIGDGCVSITYKPDNMISGRIRQLDEASRREVTTEMQSRAMLIRAVEQRLLDLFSQGKLFGTVHTCIGQEWVGVAVAEALREGDLIFSNHRCHGHFLARTDDVVGLLAEIMGKETGVCGGRGGSQHICSQGVFSNGIQGSIAPVSAGLAMAQQIADNGNVTVLFIGDGTLGEGTLYETLNIVSKWSLPLFIVLEYNGYAQSTSQEQTLAGEICLRAASFGIRTDRADTWHPDVLLAAAAEGIDYVRNEGKPAFLRVDTYRLMAHSKGDDDRDEEEVQSFWQRDPITRFAEQQPDEYERLQHEITTRVDEAVGEAESAVMEQPVAVVDEFARRRSIRWTSTEFSEKDRVVGRIHAAMANALENDERTVVIGEDIEGPYGGAFKVTKDLSQRYPERVRNTPISEAAIVGIGTGLAMSGRRPIVEIMFGDFMTLCCDQLLNSAAKFRYMYNDQVQVPLIVRTPMGGKRGYGPTHSQSIEKHFLGMPDTWMLAVHHRYDPFALYASLFSLIDRPTVVIENKLLYGVRVGEDVLAGFFLEHTDDAFPTTRLRPDGEADATVLCYGGMLPDVERAVETLFDEHDIICEVICPTRLYPLDPWPIVGSIERTGRLLVVEEGVSFAAFGAEVAARMAELCPGSLKALKRVSSPEHAIPSCGPLEKQLLPGVSHIVDGVRELVEDV